MKLRFFIFYFFLNQQLISNYRSPIKGKLKNIRLALSLTGVVYRAGSQGSVTSALT